MADALRLTSGRYTATRPATGKNGRHTGATYTLDLRAGDVLPEEFVSHLPEEDRGRFAAPGAAPEPRRARAAAPEAPAE